MAEQNPSILSHISLGSNRFDEAVAFYDQVLALSLIHISEPTRQAESRMPSSA